MLVAVTSRDTLRVGPLHPNAVLPPAALTTAIDVARRALVQFVAIDAPPIVQFLSYAGAVLDMTRHGFDGIHTGDIGLVDLSDTHQAGSYALKVYDTLMLRPTFDDFKWSSDLPLPPLRLERLPPRFSCRSIESWFFNTLVTSVHASFARPDRLESVCLPCAAVVKALHHSPYDPRTSRVLPHKIRFTMIELLSNPESASAVASLEQLLDRFPRMLILRGWCGGIGLHSASRLGNVRMMQAMLDRARCQCGHDRFGITPETLIESRNRDGSTPLRIATLFGQHQAVDLLIRTGADPMAVDRFGQIAVNESD